MKRILLLSFALITLISFGVMAQRSVSGKITDEDGESLPGVNVLIKGTTTGTQSDLDGNYRLSVEDGTTLVYSYVGFETQEIEVGARTTIDVTMGGATELQEVVVTALGSDRNAKEVVYANQTVKNEDLLSTPSKNALEALRGKTAGVRLSTGSGSPGASTRIVLRGESSLTGNNNALIVVDGVPIDNSSTTAGRTDLTLASQASGGYADHGNRFNDINPDDIESLTILKGPSATSLYGSRGAAGVILITTKKGKKGGVKINLNSSYSVEEAYVLMQRQDQFGQGFSNQSFDSGENWSWGPRVDGITRPWTSPVDADGDGELEWLSRPYSAVPDQIESFFQNGYTLTNSLSLSGGSEDFTYYISYSNVDQEGTLENTGYDRHTLTVSSTAKFTDKLKSDFKVSYAKVDQRTAQEGGRAFEGQNPYSMVLQSPITIPWNELRDYNSPYHDINGYWGSYSSVNPYYILNEFGNEGHVNNFLGNASLSYEIIEGLTVSGRIGTNVVSTEVETWVPKFTPNTQLVWGDNLALTTRNAKYASPGEYNYYHSLRHNVDVSALASYSKRINDEFSFDVSLGYNSFRRNIQISSGETFGGLLVEGIYSLGNSVSPAQATLDRSRYRIWGMLANARIGFRDALFLELSGRQDRSSTLPEENNTFSYSAVGVSAVITDLLEIDNEVLTFAKVRGSIGTTGKDAPLYRLSSQFFSNPGVFGGSNPTQFPIGSQASSTVGNRIGSPDLAPELTTTYEVGADIGLFGERVNIAYTFYHSDHKDQIVDVTLPFSSGYTVTSRNIGLMTNEGHELSLTVKPIYGLVDGLNLELFGTYSKNVNEVVKVSPDADELAFGTFRGVTVVAKEGLPYGTFKAITPLTNDNGQTVVDPNTGWPLYSETEAYLGSYQPDYMASFGANGDYKGIGFNILFDMKQGGEFFSYSKFYTEFNGTSLHTVVHDREPFVEPNSVIDNGDGTFSPNTIETTEENYFTSYNPAASTYLVDASYLKLREIGLNYRIPSSILDNTPVRSAKVSIFAKNVKFWLPSDNTFADPEINGPNPVGNAVGVETSQIPPSRSYGVSLQLSF